MKSITTKTTKKGNTVYFMVDENGKKRQVSRKTAQEFIASNNKEENKMENNVGNLTDSALAASNSRLAAFHTANEASNNNKSADIAETDGTEEDDEINEVWALLPAISELNDVSDTESAKIDNTAAIKTAKKSTKKAKEAERQQKWLANAKVDSDGKYQIVIDCDLDNRGDHKSWTPYTWIITNDDKRVRISYKFAIELADSGRAIEVNKAESKKAA